MSRAASHKFRKQYYRMMRGQDEGVDLGRAALLISGEVYPDLNLPQYINVLDSLADEARQYTGAISDSRVALERLSEYLFVRQGFRGNQQDYYDPRNSYLNLVLDRHLGIPITLSLLYIEVGRRLGLALEGVGLPGHFVVRAEYGEEEMYVDAFHGGRLLTRDECARMVEAMFQGRIQFHEEHLVPYTRKQILVRMLSNLKGIYLRTDRIRRAVAAADLIAITHPTIAANYKDRAWMLSQLREYGLAINDLQMYLKTNPSAPDIENVRRQIRSLWCMIATSN